MKRIVFLDYVRVFACFLVMVVHASENFYVRGKKRCVSKFGRSENI